MRKLRCFCEEVQQIGNFKKAGGITEVMCASHFLKMATVLSGTLQFSEKTYKVPLRLHQLNRQRLCQQLRARADIPTGAVVLLQGGKELNRFNTDTEYIFRQESFFKWAFGVEEPGCYGLLNVESGEAALCVPRLPDSYAVWIGKVHALSHFKNKYGVEAMAYSDEVEAILRQTCPPMILLLQGKNTDSDLIITAPNLNGVKETLHIDTEKLYDEMVELRMVKTADEIELMRHCAKVSSDAHKVVMKAMKPGLYEYQMDSIFQHHVYYHSGMRHLAYTAICACGPNSSLLHYGHAGAANASPLIDGHLFLADIGGEYHGYASDITITIPVNGKFTAKQKVVYNAVLDANRQVLAAAKPGVNWADMHRLSEYVILSHLRNAGLVEGNLDEMVAARLGAVFMPHGLGHLLGLDTHDVGGYPPGVHRINEPGLKSLRMNRPLLANMVLTIEPGCYFSNYSIDKALEDPSLSRFLVAEKLNEYRGIGGVRIEDDVLITETGAENLVSVPRTVKEIEAFMAQT